MRKIKIGIVGCGVIGNEIGEACTTRLKERVELVACFDLDEKKSKALSEAVKSNISVDSLDALFKKSDLVVESASVKVSRDILKKAIDEEKSVLIMSIGGLIESQGLLDKANEKGVKVFLPSGAVCGLDAIKAGKVANIESITLTTRKPPRGLEGAPYLKEKNIDINSIKSEKLIFEGSAKRAIKGFPKNVNVASLLSLAGLGPDKTKVRIITSPEFTKNSHEIEIMGDFGKITTKTENVPFEKNPKTSKLAALSAIATLKGALDSVNIGT